MPCAKSILPIACFLIHLANTTGLKAALSDSAKVRRDSLVRTASAFNANGRYIDAARCFLLAGADTGLAPERFGLGMAYSSLNDVQRASKYLRDAVNIDSTNVSYRFSAGTFSGSNGFIEEGQTEYEAILQQDSSYLPASPSRTAVHSNPETYEEAAAIYRRVLELSPSDFLRPLLSRESHDRTHEPGHSDHMT